MGRHRHAVWEWARQQHDTVSSPTSDMVSSVSGADKAKGAALSGAGAEAVRGRFQTPQGEGSVMAVPAEGEVVTLCLVHVTL